MDELVAVRINARSGDPWLCTLGWAQYLAGTLDKGFEIALNGLGWMGDLRITRKVDAEIVRNDFRLPFLSWLFGREITTCKDLTAGEAYALGGFMAVANWVQILRAWVEWTADGCSD